VTPSLGTGHRNGRAAAPEHLHGECPDWADPPGGRKVVGHDRRNGETSPPGYAGSTDGDRPGELLTHLALAVTRHVRQMRHDGLRVPGSIDELAAILAHCVRTRLAPTTLDDQQPTAHDGGVAGRLLVTKAEAAEQLGVSVRTIERLVAAGRLPLLHIEGAARLRQIDIEAYVESLATGEETPRRGAEERENRRI
jgi:excisionase family DNA binding protein